MTRYDLTGKRIWVAGHRGMVGSALIRRLANERCDVLTVDRSEVDLTNRRQVDAWLDKMRPDAVIIAAAKVGGIVANASRPAEFLFENLAITTNVIDACHLTNVQKLLFLGSSCIYPKFAPQPIPESALLTGPLEPTNEWYAIAKICGIKLCQAYRRQHDRDFVSAMPCNLYGPGDNFDLTSSHVIPALIRKAHAAKLAGENDLTIWGSGTPLREFLYVEDCADALIKILKSYSEYEHINVGSGQDIAIRDLARVVMSVVGLNGSVILDETKPDGTPRKLLDITKLKEMNWEPSVGLREGIEKTYSAYRSAVG